MSITLSAVTVLCAPLIIKLRGFPPFPLAVQLSSGVISFLLMVPVFWFALPPRRGLHRTWPQRIGLIAIALILIIFGLLLLRNS